MRVKAITEFREDINTRITIDALRKEKECVTDKERMKIIWQQSEASEFVQHFHTQFEFDHTQTLLYLYMYAIHSNQCLEKFTIVFIQCIGP